MRNTILFLVCSLYILMNYYIGSQIVIITKNNTKISIILYILIAILSIITILTYILSDKNIGSIIGKIGSYWMGFSLLIFFILLVMKILNKIIGIFNFNISNRYMTIFSLLISLVIFCVGIYNASKINVINYNIEINKNCNISNLKIVAISDLHLGYINDNYYLKKSVEIINNENPDLVVFLGDIFDGNFKAIQEEEEVRKLLNSIKSKFGTYLCWGNHDAGNNFNLMKEFINNTNIKLLEDEFVNIDNKFYILGRKDSSPIGDQGIMRKKLNGKLKNFDKNEVLITLDHRPSNIDEYINISDLVLSGHTHGGQIFPFNFITNKYYTTDYGHNIYGDNTHCIVSSGLGTWGPPIRLGTNNEIVCINVKFK